MQLGPHSIIGAAHSAGGFAPVPGSSEQPCTRPHTAIALEIRTTLIDKDTSQQCLKYVGWLK